MQTKSFITGEKNILKILKLQGLVGEMLQITENIALGSLQILYIFASCMGKPVTLRRKYWPSRASWKHIYTKLRMINNISLPNFLFLPVMKDFLFAWIKTWSIMGIVYYQGTPC